MEDRRSAVRLLAGAIFTLGIVLPLMWLPIPVAQAAGITVNTLVDEDLANGDCSLREAIIAANTNAGYRGCSAGSGADTIGFSLAGTIPLSSTLGELPTITSTVTIGGHASGTTISGAGSRVLSVVAGSNSVTLTNLTITNGDGSAGGGGGGLIGLSGNINVSNVVFVSNTAGIGTGGALYAGGGSWNIANTTFSGNTAGDGGAVSQGSGILTITTSAFDTNVASNYGGAIYISANGMKIINSTFYSNTAGRGGGIATYSTISVINSTFSNNRGITSTGAITSHNASVLLYNTIIANSVSSANCGGTFIQDIGNNLQFGGTVANSCDAIPTANPNLAAFGNHGGPTKTMPPLPGSFAIDAGNDFVCTSAYSSGGANGVDQRGTPRPQGAHCDIGAVETVFAFLPLVLR